MLESPQDPEAYVLLADLDFQDGRWVQADLLYKEGLEKLDTFDGDPQRKQGVTQRALMGIAAVAGVRGDLATAEQKLQTVLADKPDNIGALQQLARVLVQQDKPDEALEKLRAAAEIDKGLLTPEAVLAQGGRTSR